MNSDMIVCNVDKFGRGSRLWDDNVVDVANVAEAMFIRIPALDYSMDDFSFGHSNNFVLNFESFITSLQSSKSDENTLQTKK